MKKIVSILLTMTMLVSCLISAGIVYAEDSLVTPYGTIGSDYADAQSYPWVLFDASSNFIGGYNTFGTTSAGGVLGMARWYDGCTIYLRRDIADSGRYLNLVYHKTNNIDLGGHTLTISANNPMFEILNKGSGGNSKFNVSNGTIALKSWSLISYSESAPTIASSAEFTFTNVTFKLAENASLTDLIATYSATAYSKAITSNIVFNDCVFDMTANVPASGINLIGAGDVSNTVTVNITVNGSVVKATSMDGIKIASINNNNSKVAFAPNASDEYLILGLPAGSSTPSESLLLNTGEYGEFLFSSSADGVDYYEIGVLDVIPTEYGDIPIEYASVDAYPFAVFKADGTFVGAYAKWSQGSDQSGALPSARWAGDGCVILMRRDFAHGDISAYPNLSNANHTHNLDLGGYTLTISSQSSGLFYAQGKAHADVTTVNIKNGSIKVNSEAIVHTWAGAGKTFNFNFTDVNIGFASGAKPSNLICVNAKQDYSNYTTNFNFNNCNIDFKTNAPAGMEVCFEVGTSTAAENNNFTLKDCTITAPNTDTIPLYSINNENSSIIFDSSDGEKYLTLITVAAASKPQYNFATTAQDGASPSLALYDVTSSLKTYYLTTKAALVSEYGEIPLKYESGSSYPFALFDANGNFINVYGHWGGNDASGVLGSARWYDGSIILLRTNYKMSNTNGRDGYPNLGHHEIKFTVDLGGYAFDTSESDYYMFNFATRDNKTKPFGMIVKNGTIIVGKNPVLNFSYGGSAAQNYTVNYGFNDVCFKLAQGATTSNIFGYSVTDATNKFLNVNLALEDCVYDFGANVPANGITLFNAGDVNGNTTATVTVAGGSIAADDYANVRLSSLNNAASKINFAKGSDDKLLTATIAAEKDITHEPVSSDGKKFAFADRQVADGVATYTIAETDDFEMWLKDDSVEVYNVTGACKLYLASYTGNEVTYVHVIDVTENTSFDIPAEFEGAEILKAFLWNENNIAPLCVDQWVVLNTAVSE